MHFYNVLYKQGVVFVITQKGVFEVLRSMEKPTNEKEKGLKKSIAPR